MLWGLLAPATPMRYAQRKKLNMANDMKNGKHSGSELWSARHAGNILGAFSRAVSDRIDAATQKAAGLNGSACEAIIQVGAEPNCSIETLRRRLALEHSSVVRVIDRLERAKIIARKRGLGNDRREVALALTRDGVALKNRILGERGKFLDSVISRLSGEQRATLEALIDAMLPAAVEPGDAALIACRLCDQEICPQDSCPVRNAHTAALGTRADHKRAGQSATRP